MFDYKTRPQFTNLRPKRLFTIYQYLILNCRPCVGVGGVKKYSRPLSIPRACGGSKATAISRSCARPCRPRSGRPSAWRELVLRDDCIEAASEFQQRMGLTAGSKSIRSKILESTVSSNFRANSLSLATKIVKYFDVSVAGVGSPGRAVQSV